MLFSPFLWDCVFLPPSPHHCVGWCMTCPVGQVAVGVMSAFAVVWAIFRTWAWSSRNGKAEVDTVTLVSAEPRTPPQAGLPRASGGLFRI